MIAWSSTALIISVAFRLMEPWPLKLIFDSLSQSHSKRTAWLVDALHLQNVDRSRLVIGSCLAIALVTGLRALADYAEAVGFARIGNRVLTDIRNHLYCHMQGLSLKFHDSARSGDLIIRVISDVNMPGLNGIELLKRVKASRAVLPVIIMTGHGDIPLAVEAMKLGAVDFLEKPFEDDHLVGMIDAALRQAESGAREAAMTQDIVARIDSLSPRERQVMEGLVAGLSNKMIARDYNISPRTIEVYRANVMTKMQASSLSELVRLAMQAGVLKT